jgi:hypothetical protein
MIGAARNAQLAGWGTAPEPPPPAPPRIDSGVVTESILVSPLVTRPLYTVNFAPLSATTGFVNGMFLGNNSSSDQWDIDTSNTSSTDGRFSTAAYTFRIGGGFLPAANSYAPGFVFGPNFQYSGGQDQRLFGVFRDDFSVYNFFAQAQSIRLNPSQFNNIRGKWCTMLVSSTTDPEADFSNWSGGDDWQGQGWAQRLLLVDLESGTVVSQADGWAFRSGVIPSLSETWSIFGDGNRFGFFIGLGELNQGGADFEFAAAWYAVGDCLDPRTHWPEIAGTGVGLTVQGVRPLMHVRLIDTDYQERFTQNNSLRGYAFDIDALNTRLPAESIISAQSDFFNTSSIAPTLTEY